MNIWDFLTNISNWERPFYFLIIFILVIVVSRTLGRFEYDKKNKKILWASNKRIKVGEILEEADQLYRDKFHLLFVSKKRNQVQCVKEQLDECRSVSREMFLKLLKDNGVDAARVVEHPDFKFYDILVAEADKEELMLAEDFIDANNFNVYTIEEFKDRSLKVINRMLQKRTMLLDLYYTGEHIVSRTDTYNAFHNMRDKIEAILLRGFLAAREESIKIKERIAKIDHELLDLGCNGKDIVKKE